MLVIDHQNITGISSAWYKFGGGGGGGEFGEAYTKIPFKPPIEKPMIGPYEQ